MACRRQQLDRIHAPMGLEDQAIARGDRHLGGGGDDRGAPQSEIELALAVDVRLRRGVIAGAVEVSVAGLILAAGEVERMGSPKRCWNSGETFLDRLTGSSRSSVRR